MATEGWARPASAPDDLGERLRFPGPNSCIGCSDGHPHGLELPFHRLGDTVVGRPRVPASFGGGPGIVHGGIVSLLLDEYSCAASYFLRGRVVVTGTLNVRFARPCPVDTELIARARLVDESHPRYAEIEAELWLEGRRVARSTGRFFPVPVEAWSGAPG